MNSRQAELTRHVLFRVDQRLYALALLAVREVVTAPVGFTRVPRAPAAVKGVINLRGRVVMVVDLSVLLDVPTGVGMQLLLLDRGRREFGLLVANVESIEPLETVTDGAFPASGLAKGSARWRAQSVTVLDSDRIDGALAAAFDER